MQTPTRIMVVIGTRPEAIKMAPLVLALRARPEFETLLCLSGQHRDMLKPVLDLFNLQANFDLALMQAEQTLPDLTGRILQAVDKVLAAATPALMLVHGDTTTSFAAALAAFYRHVPVAHVEAGLRTGNLAAPWPEEANRKLTAVLSRWHFAPTHGAKAHLLREGVRESTIHITGNTVIDALLETCERLKDPVLSHEIAQRFAFLPPGKPLLLVTGHRRENFGTGFELICQALLKCTQQHPELNIVYPVHLNPQVREPVQRLLGKAPLIHLCEPLDYLAFVYLMQRASIILTDSGGIQEEAPALGKPVLVMREATERPEALEAGTVRLVGTAIESIATAVDRLLNDRAEYDCMSKAQNPYGDGKACQRIVEVLLAERPFRKEPA